MHFRGTVQRRATLGAGLILAVASLWFWPPTAQRATASGETRTLSIYNIHTQETITVTYKRNGKYDADAIKQLDHFMRDWRKNEERDMDPELIDHIWILHQELGSKEPVHLICGYRTASTNENLRRHGGGQAKFSQHILGKAADITFPDVPLAKLRASALIQEWGGVGYYPTSGVPFVHVDTGRVRMWPRMPRLELAALFPSGHSQYIPADGKPITPHDYQLALAKGLTRDTMIASADRELVRKTQTASDPVTAADPEVAEDDESGSGMTPPPLLAAFAAAPPAEAPAPAPVQPSLPPQKRFIYASLGGAPTGFKSATNPAQLPLARNPEAINAPELGDNRPAELSYAPFAVASLMTDVSVTYSQGFAAMVQPEQKNLDYLFEDMDHPVALSLRPSSDYRGLAAAQTFSGHAVRSIYAEATLGAPTKVADISR